VTPNSDEQELAMDPMTVVDGRESEPRVMRLADLVAGQETAVVSRTLVKRDTGSVTLFAFAADQGLSEHTAPFDALVHVLEGEVTVRIDGKPFRLGAGDAIRMPAHRPHALQAVTAFKMVLTMLR
jgi:quercetin dioxygenase-like cupin family protein